MNIVEVKNFINDVTNYTLNLFYKSKSVKSLVVHIDGKDLLIIKNTLIFQNNFLLFDISLDENQINKIDHGFEIHSDTEYIKVIIL